MATQSNIDIKIIAEFIGKNAFKQADSAANKLNKSVKSLGASFGLAFGGAALGYAIKSTIKDFADAERETLNLTNTVKNLGLAFDAPQVTAYVEKIGKLYGVTGDQAVPALQALLSATGSVSKSTQIFNTALDLAASRSANVGEVAKDLAAAYVGNTKSLNQYDLGLTKAELSAKTFEEIMAIIGSRTMGAADESAKSLSGQLAILSEVTNQAKERIGGGLFEALGGLAGPNGAGGAAKTIENLSVKLTNAISGFGYLTREVKIAQPVLVAAGIAIGLAWAPWFTALSVAALAVGALGNAMKKNTPQIATNTGKLFFPGSGDGGYAEREAARKKAEQDALARNKQLAQFAKDQAKAAAQILKDKRLAALIDKAQLKIGKGTDLFDIEKVQIAAALTNQAEQLGKATNTTQVLQIANDTARLNVKRSILDVEDAIAAKDSEAIEAALKKLDGDLKVLGVLNNQKITLGEISTLLKSLQAADIKGTIQYTDNITETIKRLQELYKIQMDAENALLALKLKNARDIANIDKDTLLGKLRGYSTSAEALVKLSGVEREVAVRKLASDIGTASFIQGITAGLSTSDAATGARYAAQTAYTYYINITAGIGDPNAIAEEVNNILNEARNRGTLVTGVTIA